MPFLHTLPPGNAAHLEGVVDLSALGGGGQVRGLPGTGGADANVWGDGEHRAAQAFSVAFLWD